MRLSAKVKRTMLGALQLQRENWENLLGCGLVPIEAAAVEMDIGYIDSIIAMVEADPVLEAPPSAAASGGAT